MDSEAKDETQRTPVCDEVRDLLLNEWFDAHRVIIHARIYHHVLSFFMALFVARILTSQASEVKVILVSVMLHGEGEPTLGANLYVAWSISSQQGACCILE
jgi:hypothetical protein